MGSYLVRRFLLMALTLFGMSILIFVMLRLVPGDIADILVDAAGIADAKEKAKIAKELGLDRPIIEQYGQWIGGLTRGDLGFAYVSERPAIEEIAPRIPISAKLTLLALFFSVILGVPFGVISAVRQNTTLDYFLRVLSLSGLSLPSFWLGLLVLMASVHWFGTIPIYTNEPRGFLQEVGLLAIPAAVVGFRSSALIMRLTRSSMLEVMRQDYIRTARSKGATNTSVNYNHALRNALLPVVTMVGVQVGSLLGGSVLVESVFSWPGLGRLAFETVQQRDYNVLLGILFMSSLLVIAINLAVDLLYAALDPRIEVR
jgi:peptide/nickel transport system permease protein